MKNMIISLMLFSLLLSGCTPSPKEQTDGAAENTAGATVMEENEDVPPKEEPSASPVSPDQNAETPADQSIGRSEPYVNIIKSNQYFMKARVQGEDGIHAFSVSVNGDSTAMETVSDGKTYNTVIRDGVTYMIDHQNKIVITSGAEVSSSASNMAGDALRAEGITFVQSGNGAFIGESLSFDEYRTPAGGTLRFYFREDKLAGIESIDNEEILAYQIEELSSGHRAEMHEVPSAYTLLDMASLGG